MKPLSRQTALVTGARGFIGSEIVRQLKQSDAATLTRVGRTGDGGQDFHELDLRDRDAVTAWATEQPFFDTVFHAAGKIDHSLAPDIYPTQIALHINATVNLLDALISQKKIGRWIQVGSATEYGNAPCPHEPDTREAPTTAYGYTKWASSQLTRTRALTDGFDAIIVRPYLTYGAGQETRSFLGSALAATSAGEDFPTTLAEQTRDFVSVEKVGRDLIALAQEKTFTSRVVNIGTGVEITLRRVLEYLQTKCPGFAPQFGALPYRNGEMMRSVGVVYRPVSEGEAWRELCDFLDRSLSAASLSL